LWIQQLRNFTRQLHSRLDGQRGRPYNERASVYETRKSGSSGPRAPRGIPTSDQHR
jgi:hypothetical protein